MWENYCLWGLKSPAVPSSWHPATKPTRDILIDRRRARDARHVAGIHKEVLRCFSSSTPPHHPLVWSACFRLVQQVRDRKVNVKCDAVMGSSGGEWLIRCWLRVKKTEFAELEAEVSLRRGWISERFSIEISQFLLFLLLLLLLFLIHVSQSQISQNSLRSWRLKKKKKKRSEPGWFSSVVKNEVQAENWFFYVFICSL